MIRILLGNWDPPITAEASSVAIIERAMAEVQHTRRQVERTVREFTVPVGSTGWRAYSAPSLVEQWFRRRVYFISDPFRHAVDRLVSRWSEVTREVVEVCPDAQAWLPSPEQLADMLAIKVESESLTEAHLSG